MRKKKQTIERDDIERARRFLRTNKGYMAIRDATGLDYFWLSRFATGRIEDPRASLLFRLLDYVDEMEGNF
tara:strand:- start:6204 stop:6416 length:213 start_codon:yes stop_codon:yes gene_type:complete